MKTRLQRALLPGLVAIVVAAPAWAQQATPAKAPATSAPQGYSYDPAGRRDPFVSLMHRGTDSRTAANTRPVGLQGLPVGEAAVKGIVQSRNGYVAMLQAPDEKTYIVRSGDRLLDASIKAITADAVVFVQQVTDPLSLVKQREIRRPLRPTEEGK